MRRETCGAAIFTSGIFRVGIFSGGNLMFGIAILRGAGFASGEAVEMTGSAFTSGAADVACGFICASSTGSDNFSAGDNGGDSTLGNSALDSILDSVLETCAAALSPFAISFGSAMTGSREWWF